ncbi:MAG: NADAR family protein [Vicingus serpentipes]|nr:NADAR family protein [Vicingus serpentipes]
MKTGVIAGFRGEYRWLSNFEKCDILYKGIIYKSTEAAYQAQKTMDIKTRYIFAKLDARESKTLGKQIIVRPDWDLIKVSVMEDICRIKFNLPQFKSRLVDTGKMEIVESNYWGDTFWGICDGIGENRLGKIIMKIRNEIIEDLKKIDNA